MVKDLHHTPEAKESPNLVSAGLNNIGTGIQRIAGWADQLDDLPTTFSGPVGAALGAVAGIGEAGLYAAGGALKTAGDLADGRFADAARRVVSTGVGAAVTAVPWIEHTNTVDQAMKLAQGDLDGAAKSKSLAERADDKAFSYMGGHAPVKEEQSLDRTHSTEAVAEAKQNAEILKTTGEKIKKAGDIAGFVPVIGTVAKAFSRAAGGSLLAADDLRKGEYEQAGRTTAAHAASAGVTLVPGVDLVNAGLAGNELLENEGDIGKTIDSYESVQDKLERNIGGRDDKKILGEHTARVMAKTSNRNAATHVEMLAQRDAAMAESGGRGFGSNQSRVRAKHEDMALES